MTTNYPNPVDGDVQACKPKRIDHSKLAAEIVHNLVSTDSCDEEVTEKLILWVINRLNKEFPTPPAQLLRPVELPARATAETFGGLSLAKAYGWNACLAEVQRLNATAQPVNDGCKVPDEPTPEMQTAGATAIRFDTTPVNKLFTANAVYRAMLAAAPGGQDE